MIREWEISRRWPYRVQWHDFGGGKVYVRNEGEFATEEAAMARVRRLVAADEAVDLELQAEILEFALGVDISLIRGEGDILALVNRYPHGTDRARELVESELHNYPSGTCAIIETDPNKRFCYWRELAFDLSLGIRYRLMQDCEPIE